jgi:hypothetical protein
MRGIPRFAGRRNNPVKGEIAKPFGLAMTACGVQLFAGPILGILGLKPWTAQNLRIFYLKFQGRMIILWGYINRG